MEEDKIKLTFTRDKTKLLKGIAIIFMVIHHTAPADFASSFKLCVGLFTFLAGFGFFFAKDKTHTGALKRAFSLLKHYWFLLFIFIVPVVLLGHNAYDFRRLPYEMFGLEINLNWYSWYVKFYVWAMLCLPLLCVAIDKFGFWGFAGSIFLSWGAECLVHLIPDFHLNVWSRFAFDCLLYSPLLFLGYWFAHKGWINKISFARKWAIPICLLSILLFVGVFFARSKMAVVAGFNLDFIYVPLQIICVLIVFEILQFGWFERLLHSLGDYSMWIWRIHALFFTAATAYVYSWMVEWARPYIGLFTIIVLVVAALMAIAIDWLYTKISSINLPKR